MPALLSALILSLSLLPFAALGAGDPGPSGAEAKDPVLERYDAAAAREDWAGAAGLLREAVARAPGNAEYHNRYAYALRKGPSPDMKLVFTHYGEALKLNPEHRGAHEYIGEAYLMVGDLAKAKEHLGALDKLCFLPCEEYSDLKKAIAAYEAR